MNNRTANGAVSAVPFAVARLFTRRHFPKRARYKNCIEAKPLRSPSRNSSHNVVGNVRGFIIRISPFIRSACLRADAQAGKQSGILAGE